MLSFFSSPPLKENPETSLGCLCQLSSFLFHLETSDNGSYILLPQGALAQTLHTGHEAGSGNAGTKFCLRCSLSSQDFQCNLIEVFVCIS